MLGLLDKFRKKAKTKTNVEPAKPMTELEQVCGNDKETYEALIDAMFLDPGKVGTSMKEAAENARKFEKAKDLLKATLWYEIAGRLAVYEGNVEKVVEFFSESQRLSPDRKFLILKNPEKAVTKARQYYEKYLKA